MRSIFKKFPPSIVALLLQLAAFVLVSLTARNANFPISPMIFSLMCGLVAMTLSYFAGQARWWLAIQLLFVPGLVMMLTLDIPSSFFLAAFIILLLVYWSTFQTQVPLYLSSNKVWRALEDLLPKAQTEGNFSFIDLGSGLGGVLTHLASVRPDGRYTGIESAPLPLLWSWLRIKYGQHQQCQVHWGSIWDDKLGAGNLAQYDVVFAYLSPVPMLRLWHKARAEMRPGTVFISSTFSVPDQSPHEIIQIEDLHHSSLMVWRM